MSLLIYNEKTGEARLTVANPEGKVFGNYIKAGFKPICRIYGRDRIARNFPPEDRKFYDEVCNRILKDEHVY